MTVTLTPTSRQWLGRRVVVIACLLGAPRVSALPSAQATAACSLNGAIKASGSPLPGVVVTLAEADGRVVEASSTGLDGSYSLKLSGAPRSFTLRASLVAFAPIVRDITIDPGSCAQRRDLEMTLASRTLRASANPQVAPVLSPATRGSLPTRGIGRRGLETPNAQPQFQSLELLADHARAAQPEEEASADDTAAQVLLPAGFSPETSAESVTSIGAARATAGFFGPNGPGDFKNKFGNGFDATGAAAPDELGGFTGGGKTGGKAGKVGKAGKNEIRGSIFQSFDTSVLDTAPFALNGQPTTKPDYFQQRFGATLGGPLVIGSLINDPRTFFFLNYTANHSRNPFDAYSTVPTLAERGGDLSGLGRTILDPRTGQPFSGNQIPAARLDPAAQALLALTPTPNQTGDRQNFHTVTTTTSQLDDINLRLVHAFGAVPKGRGKGAGKIGKGGGRTDVSNLNLRIHYRHAEDTASNPFPTLGNESTTSAWDIPATYSFTARGLSHALRFGFNRQRAQTNNLYAGNVNLSGAAGLVGTSPDPFDWGAPNLSLSSFTSVRDTNPSLRTDRTLSIGDTVVKTHGRHAIRFGGDYRDIHADSRRDANARGTFVFTGVYSGSDFGDFLLGLPQHASVQYGPGLEQFRSRSGDLFLQDDWRAGNTVTINAGLRYEYFSPLSEANNRLVTLDTAPGFTAAVPVAAGGTGPFSGTLPDTIVRPFRGGFEPRVGIAWRPKPGTVVRAGYGVNYNASVYQTIAQQLAGQPPFAAVSTVISTPATVSPLETALLAATPGSTQNTYAVDPNYHPGSVQIWNLDVQRDLSRTVQIGIGYTGTKGTHLDLLEAPNRTATGLLVPTIAPYLYETSSAVSQMNSLNLRIRKRLSDGFAISGSYVLSKSIDDASSIAGAGGTVAQDPTNLLAERGLSSFDQRHRFTGTFTWELPFGASRRWFQDGVTSELFGNWVLNGTLTLASGTPFTPYVLASASDVARGTNDTLRANYNGQPIQISDPTTGEFFNTGAFSVPAPGTYGTAARDTIQGPGTSTLDVSLMKNINFGQTRGLSIQVQATNVLNTVQFASIDTSVNSPTFGRVTAVHPMRRVQIQTRFRF